MTDEISLPHPSFVPGQCARPAALSLSNRLAQRLGVACVIAAAPALTIGRPRAAPVTAAA
jgi:hypothetical protein